MQHAAHRLPGEVLSALARGAGGAAAARHLRAAERSRHLLLILGVVDAARLAGHPHADVAERAYGALAAMERAAPAAVDRLIRHPAVGAWAWHTVSALLGDADGGHGPPSSGKDGGHDPASSGEDGGHDPASSGEDGGHDPASSGEGGGHDPAGLGAVAVAAAVVGGVPCEAEAPAVDGYVMLPSLGALSVPDSEGLVRLRTAGRCAVTAGGREVTVGEGVESPCWRGLHRLTAEAEGHRLSVLLDDLDPYRWPAGTATHERMTGPERLALAARLREAWRVLVAGHWTIAEETASIVTVLTPIHAPEGVMKSASSKDHFGAVALSPPPDALRLAGTFAHEVQHAKLSALLSVTDLVQPDDGRRFYAPWRDDPRPASGLLHGAYAYLGVSGFWRRQRALLGPGEERFRAEVEFVRWREAAYQVTGTLAASGRLTRAGDRFVEGMRGTLQQWLKERVPKEAVAVARQESGLHRHKWTDAHG
ncbi:HEXXH motif domain-containing protein [Nonomuraea lactucae]|uniref:HEXXH motif domain-containing protein n=1 Tax=Nonomuraea lactucae TaxID=2249762 RepID=UPI0013B3FACB|nr:HEXXH motif domain-containing protein [Nonomuraea lactucae]